MASSSSSHPDVFSGTWRKVDESSKLYDVFINHRGPDVKQTVALNLYNSLKKLGIKTFLDKEEKELGKSFLSTIETAINSALVHIAIFSENYAESSWCLEELLLMLRSKTKIIPLFYKVKPFDLRFVENGRYAKAFTDYEKKKRYIEKLSEWKDALRSVSFIAGVEISDNFNISDYQNIVLAVRNEIRRRSLLYVAKHPVGLDRLEERLCLHQHVEDFERKCRTNEGGRKKAQIFGIVGMGGVGKTTLAKELFNRKLLDYSRVCFLFDVREAYENNRFHHLQMQLLQHLFQRQFNFLSIEEGKSHIDGCIRRNNHSSFLILLDDVDDMKQLDALLIMEMLKNSDDNLVIVTTRDAGVLIKTGIAETYKLTEMNRNYAGELFCQHAFGRPNPDSGYENLVSSFLDVCGGLPLSLQVLGSHVHGTNQNYWSLELKKVIKTLPQDIYQRLKISFDALDYEEQQIFMDLACFFVEQSKSIPIEVWEASGWSAQHALKTLENRCLVQEIEIRDSGGQKRSVLGMHDHLRDLGRKVAESSSGPRRLWCPRELPCLESSRFQDILSEPGNRCFHSFYDKPTARQITYFLGDSDKNADTSTFFKLKELESIKCIIILKNLRCLIFWEMPSQTLWQRHLQASNNLKELQIRNTSLDKRLDLSGICNSLEKLLIYNCSVRLVTLSGLSYLVELNISGCDGLDELSAVHLSCLQKMILNNCCRLKTVSGSDLRKLVELGITGCPVNGQLHLAGLNSLERIQVDHSLKPKCLELDDCRSLETISGIDLRNLVTINIRNCPKLEVLPSIQGSRYLRNLVTINIRNCPKLEVLPSIQGSRYLKTVTIDGCGKPKSLLLSRFQNLEGVTLKSGVDCLEKITIEGCGKLNRLQLFKYQNLKQVSISCCWELEELPCLAGQTCLEEISLVRCEKLQDICLPPKLVELK